MLKKLEYLVYMYFRKELLDTLPQGSALVNTPFKPSLTPVCQHPKQEETVTPVAVESTTAIDLPKVPPKHDVSSDFVRIPKSEYEEIKSRVSAIEDRITLELNSVQVSTLNVQSAYEKTLEEAGVLNSPTTDQLARRLSKELKIRRNSEQKIIRSPSARKIGSIRRRSQELTRLSRNQSCHIPRVTLKRGRPNTVLSGLPQPHPSPCKSDVNRSSSFHSYPNKWLDGETFFKRESKQVRRVVEEDRDSLARLRSQNAGMVLAKAKLFDDLSDSSDLTRSQEKKKITRRGGTFPRQNPVVRRRMDSGTVGEGDKENETSRSRSKIRSPRQRSTPLRAVCQ